MEKKEMGKKLGSLVQLDIDAVEAYRQAIEKIDVVEIRDRLAEFRADHERHIEALSAAIKGLGEEPPRRKQDIKGFLIEGFTALRSVTGTEGALKAMKTNEELTNRTYQKAISWELPTDLLAMVQRNLQDERRHLAYIEESLRTRVWEHAEHPAG